MAVCKGGVIYMSEAQEQVLLFQWAKLQENVYPELKLLFHIP